MPIASSGTLSFTDIQTEMGGTNPISISEYYGKDSQIPSSGAISANQFYSAQGPQTLTISMGSNFNLAANGAFAALDSTGEIVVTLTSNAYGTSSSNWAFDTGNLANHWKVTIQLNGFVRGAQGTQGAGGTSSSGGNGGPGGPGAIFRGSTTRNNLFVYNNDYIAAGGGGGGGGGRIRVIGSHVPAYNEFVPKGDDGTGSHYIYHPCANGGYAYGNGGAGGYGDGGNIALSTSGAAGSYVLEDSCSTTTGRNGGTGGNGGALGAGGSSGAAATWSGGGGGASNTAIYRTGNVSFPSGLGTYHGGLV